MARVICDNVSKQYQLGLTRISLPQLISSWVKSSRGRSNNHTDRPKFIWALKDVNFKLQDHQSLALVGPNGAGKTTILKILSRITQPTSGDIKVDGRLSALIELGAGFHPDLTGRENIYLNGTILGLKRKEIDQRFDEIVDFSGLEHFVDTPIKRYSSGMSVRLGFSVAACIEPDILLIDEVLAVGDSRFRQKCITRIKSLLKKGTSIIFVSHNLWLVQTICDSALYIDKGQVKLSGTPPEVIDAYDQDINLRRAEQFDQAQFAPNDFIEGAPVAITHIEILNEKESLNYFPNDEPMTIRIHYKAELDLGPINAVVRILRSDGLTCCMMRSSNDGYPIDIKQGGGTITLKIDPLQLYGGTYFIHVIFRDSEDVKGLVSKWSNSLYVLGSNLSHQEMNGVFEPNRSWGLTYMNSIKVND